MKKFRKIILRILLGLLCFIMVVTIGVYAWSKIHYHSFYTDAERSISIPGLWSGFIPQGFDYDEKTQTFLISGYMKDGESASRIYVVPQEGDAHFVELKKENGDAYTGHCGGVAINGSFIYISGSKSICVFDTEDVLSGAEAKQIGSIDTGERMSFCTYVNGYLLSGAFYRPGNYETPDYHHVTTPAGDENPALIWIYQADASAEFGIDNVPIAALSVRGLVQGIEVTDEGEVILSTSYGLASSALWLYEMDDRKGSVTVDGNEIPLYYLDSENLVETVTAPPMTEEILWLDGRVYIMTESACTKYIFGKFIDGGHVFAYQF